MEGVKKFTNNTPLDLKVILAVRAGEKPGCIYRIEEFFIRCGESRQICYGNECNFLLDGLKAFSKERGQCVEVNVAVIAFGCQIDTLLNAYNHIMFHNAGPFIVFSSFNCILETLPPRFCCT